MTNDVDDESTRGLHWRLRVTFPTLAEQEDPSISDEPARFPFDSASRVFAYLGQTWDMLPEELNDNVEISKNHTQIDIYANVIDELVDVMYFITMSTIFDVIGLVNLYRA